MDDTVIKSVLTGVPATIERVSVSGHELIFAGPRFGYKPGAPCMVVDPSAEPFETMALLNHSLPDDDPRKITRAKIVKLTQAAYFLSEQKDGRLSTAWPDDANPWRDLADELRQFAAELNALLPPQ